MRRIRLRGLTWYAAALGASIYLVGCSIPLPPPRKTPSPVAVTLFTPLPSAVLSPGPELPTSTPEPIAVPATRMFYPTWTPRTTLAPTLTADRERAFVIEMLETNGGCELPCWWGITPGETGWQIVKNLFDSVGKRTNDVLYPDGTVGHGSRNFEVSYDGYRDYYLRHAFYERAGVIQSIQVEGALYGNASEHFAQDWHRYALDQVLTRYGKPSQVRIHLFPFDNPYYGLTLVYDHLGFMVYYQGLAVRELPLVRACFRFDDVTSIHLTLQSPQSGRPLLGLSELDPSRPLEEVTGMSVEMFHETFKNPDSDVCFESPANIWP